MYLQSLEIIGFKSFAQKTVLNFHRGVTAIVGPNGCGKSNVLDAIRWVLGEQSAKALRGGEMADVIFSGTDSRKALGMAEVSMTFAECEKELGVEWNEVRITRRVHRDGRSEYFLNKAACRLRDIHQLFMDTGVGRSAYSIMEQGKIDQILSNRPEDRRAIFEEAAGITRFKAQKKEALRKLEYTESNLVRVQDIIKEVKRQIGSLQRQAAKARRYQALMKDLRVLDSNLSHRNYRALSDELAGLQQRIGQGDEARGIHEREIGQQESELATFRQQLGEIEGQADAVRDGMQTLKNRIFSGENRIQTNQERSSEAASLIERHERDISQADEKIRTQREQIQQTDTLLEQMLESLRTHQQTLDEHTAALNDLRSGRVDAERELQKNTSSLSSLESRLNSLRGEISSATGRRESGETRLRLLREEGEASAKLVDDFSRLLDELTTRGGRARLDVERRQAETAAAAAAHEQAQHARQDAEAVLNAAGKEAAAVESRLEILRQLQEQGEGLDEGTQALLKGLDNPTFFQAAMRGTVAGHIRVEERFIPAIEAALGKALQAVVFKDAGVAESALLTLAGKKLGTASLIPEDWIGCGAPAEGNLPFGVLGRASDCIAGEGSGADLARGLVGGVLVVESVEAAFKLRVEHPEFGYATLDGCLIDSSGLVHGGASGANAGQSTLERKVRIAELEAQLEEAGASMEALAQNRANAVAALEQAAAELKAGREALQAAQVESASIENERRHAERQLADAKAKSASFERETASIEESLRESLEKLAALEERIASTSCELDALRASRGELETGIQVARDRENAAAEALNDIRVRVATERQQQEGLHRQRGPMAARIDELNELLEARRTDIESYRARIASLAEENASLESSLGEWKNSLALEEEKLAALVARRSEMAGSVSALETALRAARQQLSQLQDERGKLDVKATQTSMRMENLRNHVSQRYQTDLEAFEPDSYALLCAIRDRDKGGDGADNAGQPAAGAEEVPWARVEELVAELTERLDSMGPVNVDAIQEYEELEQRHVFLEKQNADLVASKAELLEVISKINHTTKALFSETFEKVRVNFQEMFRELFGGGRANLMLVDESDPLESGIEIIAKPPGKQLQSVSLLSGGERTMTAVSLLFAIYMVKPSPFCVLDEMDAPLDESNITRFVKILDRFTDQSQFVVITHNKRTISRADMLYGVTMEEHGVSKLVSVRFNEGSDKSSRTVAESFGKSGNLASEDSAPGETPEPSMA
jgi:chromosome segregation protein